jgi:hypothetical protein
MLLLMIVEIVKIMHLYIIYNKPIIKATVKGVGMGGERI